MMNGSRTLEGFVPDVDATVESRILDAGGHIVGKSVCEDLCCSGGSFTATTGPVVNPHNKTRMCGGSSSGSAALVSKKVHRKIGKPRSKKNNFSSSSTKSYYRKQMISKLSITLLSLKKSHSLHSYVRCLCPFIFDSDLFRSEHTLSLNKNRLLFLHKTSF